VTLIEFGVGGTLTAWLIVPVLEAKFESPMYTPKIEWVPSAREDVVKVAWADAFSVPEPSTVDPSWKVTVPVGVPLADVTVAVKVTDCPELEGFEDETNEVVVPVVPDINEILATNASPEGVPPEGPP
jgi:hypothetical protein